MMIDCSCLIHEQLNWYLSKDLQLTVINLGHLCPSVYEKIDLSSFKFLGLFCFPLTKADQDTSFKISTDQDTHRQFDCEAVLIESHLLI